LPASLEAALKGDAVPCCAEGLLPCFAGSRAQQGTARPASLLRWKQGTRIACKSTSGRQEHT